MSGNYNRKKIALAGALMFMVTSVSAQTVKGVVTDNYGRCHLLRKIFAKDCYTDLYPSGEEW